MDTGGGEVRRRNGTGNIGGDQGLPAAGTVTTAGHIEVVVVIVMVVVVVVTGMAAHEAKNWTMNWIWIWTWICA